MLRRKRNRTSGDLAPWQLVTGLGVLACPSRWYPKLRLFLLRAEKDGRKGRWTSVDALMRAGEGVGIAEATTAAAHPADNIGTGVRVNALSIKDDDANGRDFQPANFGECLARGTELLETIDDLLSATEQMRQLLTNEDEAVDGSSEAVQFMRKIVANIDAVPFERICEAFERCHRFLQGDGISDENNGHGGGSLVASAGRDEPMQDSFDQYIDAVSQRKLSEAEDAIYRYFDRALVHLTGKKEGGDSETSTTGASASAFASGAQYAALSIAATHHEFGHKAESAAALNEAVNVAQQVEDAEYQQKAAGWLATVYRDWRLLQCASGDPEAELALVRHEIQTLGLGFPPEARLDRIRRHVATATGSSKPSPQISIAALLLTSAAWLLEGAFTIASSLARLALKRARGEPALERSEIAAQALCAVESLRFDAGEPESALDTLLSTASSSSPSAKGREAIAGTIIHLQLLLAFAKGEIRVAEALANRMTCLRKPDLDLHASLARTKCFWYQGDLQKADKDAAELAQEAARRRRPTFVIEAMLLQAEVHLAANAGPSALIPVLSALTFATSLHQEPLRWRATGVLARVHLALGSPADALREIRSVLPSALHETPAQQRGELLLIHAQALRCSHAADPIGAPEQPPQPRQCGFDDIAKIIGAAQRAFESAADLRGQRMSAIELAKAADAFHRIGVRDEAVRMARMCEQKLQAARSVSPCATLAALDAAVNAG